MSTSTSVFLSCERNCSGIPEKIPTKTIVMGQRRKEVTFRDGEQSWAFRLYYY